MPRPLDLPSSPFTILDARFELMAVAEGLAVKPSDLHTRNEEWLTAEVPGTVASALRSLGRFSYGEIDFDQKDYWYRADVILPGAGPVFLIFEGLATLVEVFWNDTSILVSTNMFLEHRIDMSDLPRTAVLSMRFRSLNSALKERKPRPRWKTRLVENQQIRWVRTTLLGRIPAWSPPVAPVGPFRSIFIEAPTSLSINDLDINTSMVDGSGRVNIRFHIHSHEALQNIEMTLDDHSRPLAFKAVGENLYEVDTQLDYPNPKLWWPHTHGHPKLHTISLILTTGEGSQTFQVGSLGFRSVQLDRSSGAFAFVINGTKVFSRGACWTPTDLISLGTDERALRATLLAVRDAGMNMIRIGGTMLYESPLFYQLCDELGIMVWQDFMFANMDYPVGDESFKTSIHQEVKQFLSRTRHNICLTMFCGSSEIEQQTAMLGLAHELWSNEFFQTQLPALCNDHRSDVPYWQSSPHGALLPFHVNQGVSHYYGVGAYLRPLEDARRANIRFTSECLGFSHIPETISVEKLLADGEMPMVHPKWKQRVPRDQGTGWDFEDIRDHYFEMLFRADPRALRYADSDRYLALARVTTGEVVLRTLNEWRRVGSTCNGALLWLLRDMWLGAGWGLIDADGRPKAAYYFAKRAMAPQTAFATDEGLNGLDIHVINERETPLHAELEVTFLRQGQIVVATATAPITLEAHSAQCIKPQTLFPYFIDMTYAYRFGPAGHEAVVVSLRQASDKTLISEDWYFPQGLPSVQFPDLELEAIVELNHGTHELVLRSKKWAQFVSIEIKGYASAHNYFNMAPNRDYRIALTADGTTASVQGTVSALNAVRPAKISQRGS